MLKEENHGSPCQRQHPRQKKWPSYTFVLVLRSPCNNVINHVINNVVNQANFPASDEGYNSDLPGSRVHPIIFQISL